MTSIAFLVIITSIVGLLVVGTEDMGSGHTVFASGHVTNRGINVQTDTNQDQGCEATGGTSATTNACTATSGPGSTESSVTLRFGLCVSFPLPFRCQVPFAPNFCDNIGCQTITCTGSPNNLGDCTTDNGVQLTSCTFATGDFITCTLSEPGTGGTTTSSGGVRG
jgi:hypothetical protein